MDMVTLRSRSKDSDAHHDHKVDAEAVTGCQSTPCLCKHEASKPSQASSERLQELLSERFSVIGQGLDAYCENPSAGTFMQIYTCIYDLCNGREHKNAVCCAVYELHCRETQICAQRLAASCQQLAAAPELPDEVIQKVLHEWQWLSRRFHLLQASFGYLDRYYVPRAGLETLSALRLSTLQAAGFEEHALFMWNVLSATFRDGYAAISFQRMHDLAEAWGSLVAVAGMQEISVTTAANNTLREHFAASFTEGSGPHCRPDTSMCTATDRVLGMQRPLVREIIEFLSEQDLWQVYSIPSMQTVSLG